MLKTLLLVSAMSTTPQQLCQTNDLMEIRGMIHNLVSTHLCLTKKTAPRVTEFWHKLSKKLMSHGFEPTLGSDIKIHDYTEITVSGDHIYSKKHDKLIDRKGYIFFMIKRKGKTMYMSAHVDTLTDIDGIVERFVTAIVSKEI